jgi:hypothetical protein
MKNFFSMMPSFYNSCFPPNTNTNLGRHCDPDRQGQNFSVGGSSEAVKGEKSIAEHPLLDESSSEEETIE